jgi:hypothetical protein
MICFSLPSEFFTTYRCSEPVSLSFNVDTLTSKVFNGTGANDHLIVRAESSTDDIEN